VRHPSRPLPSRSMPTSSPGSDSSVARSSECACRAVRSRTLSLFIRSVPGTAIWQCRCQIECCRVVTADEVDAGMRETCRPTAPELATGQDSVWKRGRR
jgi:hypothetical protein